MHAVRSFMLAALTVLAAAPASAQAGPGGAPAPPDRQPVQQVGALAAVLSPGTTVEVTADSTTTRGKVLDVSATALRLEVDGRPVTLAAPSIRTVDVLRRQTARGATIGGLLGAATLLASYLIAKARCDDCEDDSTAGIVAAATALYTGIGAGAGAWIGSRFYDREPLYRAPGLPVVRLEPGGAVSVGYSVRF